MDTGGQAFPVPIATHDNGLGVVSSDFQGMTLRDYFAGQALIFIMPILDTFAKKQHKTIEREHVAREAYLYADAMIKQQGKR